MTADTLTQQHGIESVAANSATEALERLDGGGFDCVVSDYEMPEMDGLELLEEIRETNPSIPFILLTGRGDEETASAAIAAGVADYLLKLEVVEDKQYGRLQTGSRTSFHRSEPARSSNRSYLIRRMVSST
nr:response regulator [Haloarcula sp. CBA1122]